MTDPSAAELSALNESGPLLRFAAEKVNNLDPALSLAIAKARVAADAKQWTPEISQEFWNAFSKLCDLIQPVTMDCLAARDQNLDSWKWNPWRTSDKISLAERSSARYLALLFVLLAITIPLQLYVWTCTSISKEISDAYSANDALIAKNAEPFRKVAASTVGAGHVFTQEELTLLEQFNSAQSAMTSNLDRALYESALLHAISTLHFSSKPTAAAPRALPENWYDRYNATVARQDAQQVTTRSSQEVANLIVGICLSFIMPVLFGMVGAVAFVIRAISDQIRSTTFSQSSPIRHVLRVGLGALAGVVIGFFNGPSTQLSLPPLAIAFLAGYGVEALFSMFDGIIDKFRQK